MPYLSGPVHFTVHEQTLFTWLRSSAHILMTSAEAIKFLDEKRNYIEKSMRYLFCFREQT